MRSVRLKIVVMFSNEYVVQFYVSSRMKSVINHKNGNSLDARFDQVFINHQVISKLNFDWMKRCTMWHGIVSTYINQV